MRITTTELNAILTSYITFYPNSKGLWPFGSRCDNSKKGGDINLFINLDENELQPGFIKKKIQFLIDLKNKIGDQQIDVVFQPQIKFL